MYELIKPFEKDIENDRQPHFTCDVDVSLLSVACFFPFILLLICMSEWNKNKYCRAHTLRYKPVLQVILYSTSSV